MIHAIAGPDRDAGIERLMQTPLPAAEEPTENNNCVCHPSNPDAPICLLESIRPAASCSKNDDITDDCSWCSAFEGEACEGAWLQHERDSDALCILGKQVGERVDDVRLILGESHFTRAAIVARCVAMVVTRRSSRRAGGLACIVTACLTLWRDTTAVAIGQRMQH